MTERTRRGGDEASTVRKVVSVQRGLHMVGGRPRADGRLRVTDERVRGLHEDARRGRGPGDDDEPKVSAVLADLETAPIDERLRATVRMLRKLTREHSVDADDMRAVLAAGVSREAIEDALAVGFIFNTVDRLSRTFGWVVSSPRAFAAGARFLLARGYR